MKKFMTMARQFRDDEDGAAMVEYSILIGIIAAATIVVIIVIGGWVTGRWTRSAPILRRAAPPAARSLADRVRADPARTPMP